MPVFSTHKDVYKDIIISSNINTKYLGSQCAILKSKLILVTNMSDSNLISWTEGGGNAMANATIPSNTVGDFRLWEKEYCGRNLLSIRTT